MILFDWCQGLQMAITSPMANTHITHSHSLVQVDGKDTLWFFAVAGAIMSLIDALSTDQSGLMVGLNIGLGLGSGLCFGLAYTLIKALIHRMPSTIRRSMALLTALVFGHLICTGIHGYTRLEGPHLMAGVISIIAAFGLPSMFIVLPIIVNKAPSVGRGRWMLGAVGGLVTMILWLAARHSYPDFYPGGMMVVMTASITCLAFTLIVVRRGRGPIPHWMHRTLWAVGLGLVINAYVYLQRAPTEMRMAFETSGPISNIFNLNVHRVLTDWDGDGYSLFLGDHDCAP